MQKNLTKIFFWPITLGVLTLFGLILALLKDGALEVLSVIALCVPVIVIKYQYLIKPLIKH